MEVIDVALSDIHISQKRRKASPAYVKKLADSILEIGLQNPIGITVDRKLIHGRHRVEAFRLLQYTTIPATVHDIDDMHAELAEIDENIQRKQLSKVEECKALSRRKEIYLALHPETKRGATGKGRPKDRKENISNLSFADDTASKTGRTARSVNMDVALGNALPDDVVQKIADSPIANRKSELKKLAKLDSENQRIVADLIRDGEVTSVSEALQCDDEIPNAEEEHDATSILVEQITKVVEKWISKYDSSGAVAAAVLENVADVIRATS